MKPCLFLILIFCFANAFSAPAIFSVGPDNDIDCNFNSIEEAVNAPNVIGRDIRVSNELINTTGVIVDIDDVFSLKGGYNNCADAEKDIIDYDKNLLTTLSNADGIALDINLRYDNESTLELSGFELINSQNGVKLNRSNSLVKFTVEMAHTSIHNNIQTGLIVQTSSPEENPDFIVNIDEAKIHNNGNLNELGGGIHCFNSQLNIGEKISINNNAANAGGGISARLCEVDLLAGDNNTLDTLEYGIFENTATWTGAGVKLSESVLTGSGNLQHPVSISKNTLIANGASTYGGGIYANSGSIILLDNARIDGNSSAFYGGAIATEHEDMDKLAPIVAIFRNESGCGYAEICSSISQNTLSTGFNSTGGAAVYMDGGMMTINHTLFDGNSTPQTTIFNVKNNASLNLNSVLAINNSAPNDVLEMENNSFVGIQYSTFAQNTTANYFNVLYDNDTPQTLEAIASIIQNGESSLANLNNDNGNHDAQFKCSLVENNDGSGVVQNQSIIGDPGFVGQTNFKLRPDSIAINSDCTTLSNNDYNNEDIRGHDRTLDATPDLGAYEFQIVDDVIYQGGFEAL